MIDNTVAKPSALDIPFVALLNSTRPRQWLKSSFVAAALIFAGRLDSWDSILRVALAMLAFVLVSAGGYLVNDVTDVRGDREHPLKRFRPVASGQLSIPVALGVAVFLGMCSLSIAAALGVPLLEVVIAYAVLTLGYSLFLKHIVIADALAIAAGFDLRALAGSIACGVSISAWLLLGTTLLAIFLVFAKRRGDLTSARSLWLGSYDSDVLDRWLIVMGTVCIVTYTVYAIQAHNLPRDHIMLITAPFVVGGILRYIYVLGHSRDSGVMQRGDGVESALFGDVFLASCVAGWLTTTLLALYWIR